MRLVHERGIQLYNLGETPFMRRRTLQPTQFAIPPPGPSGMRLVHTRSCAPCALVRRLDDRLTLLHLLSWRNSWSDFERAKKRSDCALSTTRLRGTDVHAVRRAEHDRLLVLLAQALKLRRGFGS